MVEENDRDDEIDNEEEEEQEDIGEPRRVGGWANAGRDVPQNQPIMVDTGRGNSVPVNPGANFGETIERIAEEANYGGYFRVFLNGREVVEPEEAPAVIESGMRLAITAYDKVG